LRLNLLEKHDTNCYKFFRFTTVYDREFWVRCRKFKSRADSSFLKFHVTTKHISLDILISGNYCVDLLFYAVVKSSLSSFPFFCISSEKNATRARYAKHHAMFGSFYWHFIVVNTRKNSGIFNQWRVKKALSVTFILQKFASEGERN
jgi:hypothetical protein